MKELDEALELLHREARDAPGDLTGARARLMAELHGVTPLRRRRKWQVPAAAAAVVLVAASVIGIGVHRSRTPDITLATASDVLHRAADSLDVEAVDPPLRAGQYRYRLEHVWSTRSMSTTAGNSVGATYLLEQNVERWIPANDRDIWQETRTVLGEPRLIGDNLPQGEELRFTTQQSDAGTWKGACGDFFPNSKPTKVCGDPDDWDSPEFYAKLPRDPAALYWQLVKLNSLRGGAPATVFHYAIQILSAGMMPADLRPAWYRAIAKIPGIQVVDRTTTVDGRKGVALGLTTPQERRELIIDPATGDFIGERTVVGEQPYQGWIKPGTEIHASTITTSVVNGLGETK